MPDQYIPNGRRRRFCELCKNEFSPRTSLNTYCSKSCQHQHYRQKFNQGNPNPLAHLTAGTVGAMHELVICADLMKRGFHVFRALSPSCPCDVVVVTPDGRTFRIEVKTMTRQLDGTNTPRLKGIDLSKSDVLAFVSHRGEIAYIPDWEEEEVIG